MRKPITKPDLYPCRCCGVVKSKTEFVKHKAFSDGYDRICLQCNHDKVKSWRATGKRKSRQESIRYRQRYPERDGQRAARRRAREQFATLPWIDADDRWLIAEAKSLAVLRTKITGVLWHTDHIIPLGGKNVCGLNVPWNVRVVTAQENWRKALSVIE